MQPTQVYSSVSTLGKQFPFPPDLHQCVACGMLLDEGPLKGIFPTDAEGKLVRFTVKQAVLNWCPTCREEHERIMRQLEETDAVYEGVE